MQALTRHGLHRLARLRISKIVLQLLYILREVIHFAGEMTTKGDHGALIGTWRTAKTQIYPIRIERRQRTKLLGNHQRGVVRKHYAPGTYTNRFGPSGNKAEQNRGRRTGDAGHIMVFSHPVALIAP